MSDSSVVTPNTRDSLNGEMDSMAEEAEWQGDEVEGEVVEGEEEE